MNDSTPTKRNIVFISKATPEDDAFTLWIAPRLEAQGYRVFADILQLDTGDRWRRRLTKTLQEKAVKMVLCCSDETLDRTGVQEEIGIAEDLGKELNDQNFILPLKIKKFKKLFGIGELQYIDFEKSWAEGLQQLLETLSKQSVPKNANSHIQPQWEQYQRRKQISVEQIPETLTSNWLRIMSVPDQLSYVQPTNPCSHQSMLKLARSFKFPMIPFQRGFITFASPIEMEEHFISIGKFEIVRTFDFERFLENGADTPEIKVWDARNKITDLLRQAWEKHCVSEGFLAYDFSGNSAFHVDENKIEIGKRVSWGRQGQRRYSMLRNIARGKVWEYGVSVIPSLFPYPHLRLKGRVLFSEMERDKKSFVIKDKDKQFKLRRTICSGWRNKAWHGRLMAFMELLADDSPYVALPVGSGQNIVIDASPVQFTSPVTAARPNTGDEDAEEFDPSTLGGYFQSEEV